MTIGVSELFADNLINPDQKIEAFFDMICV